MPGSTLPPSEPTEPDRLIETLVGTLRPVRRRRPLWDAALLLGIVGLELALFLLMGGMRPDMHRAMVQPSWWWKLGGLAAVALAGAGSALVSLDPSRSPRPGLRATLLLLFVCLAIGWALDSARFGLGPLLVRLDWRQGIGCVWKMAVLAVPAVLGLGVLLNRGASTDGAGTAWAAGIGAAACGAFVFVFACPSDDPLYIVVWYAVGLGVVSGMSRILLGMVTRW